MVTSLIRTLAKALSCASEQYKGGGGEESTNRVGKMTIKAL